MKRVLVSVKSVQRDMDGKDTVVELISPGTSHEKGNAQYVRYEERESVYETPYGDLHMAVNTHELTVDFHEGVGHVHLGYDISVEGEWQFYNQLDIDVREDTEHGHEGNPEIGD